jgi:sugar phosphate isomerase/epimerase
LAAAGYDYIELSVAADLVPDEDDDAWAEHRGVLASLQLQPEVFNSFIRTGKIIGPEADPDRLRRYVDRALARAHEVGGSIIVFGSGGAREIPPGFPHEQAEQQLFEFLGYCAAASTHTGVRVVIEPLQRVECNYINTVAEAAAIVRRLNYAGVLCLADTFHMERENEPMADIVDAADVLAHTHTADSLRLAPGTGTYDHVAFFRALAQADYDQRCSIECSWQDDFAILLSPALARLKDAYETAQK